MNSNPIKSTVLGVLFCLSVVSGYADTYADTPIPVWEFYTKYLANADSVVLSHSEGYWDYYLMPVNRRWIYKSINSISDSRVEININDWWREKSDSVSYPVINKDHIEWVLWDYKYKSGKEYNKTRTLILGKPIIRDIHEDTYIFMLMNNDYKHWDGYRPVFREGIMKINPDNLRNVDEYGDWNWNKDKSYIVLESRGKSTLSHGLTTKFEIIHNNGNFSLRLTTTDQNLKPAPVFTKPIARTADNLPIYEVYFTFGEEYIPLRFIGATDSEANNVVTFGSYDRFTEVLNTDATAILDEFKKHYNCVLTCKEFANIPSFVFNLEGLETILDYLK